jgi:hypothetical protein
MLNRNIPQDSEMMRLQLLGNPDVMRQLEEVIIPFVRFISITTNRCAHIAST